MGPAPRRRSLVVGWRGGVGRAVLALLERHPCGQRLAEARTLVLVDAEPGDDRTHAHDVEVLPAQRVTSADGLRELLRDAAIDELVDLAGLDWHATLDVCAALGIDSLGTSLERWDARDDLLEDAWELAPDRRPAIAAGSHVLAAGMNPGCVNALVELAITEFIRRSGVPDRDALDLGGIYVTERDTTDCDAPGDAFASSWSPSHCLSELVTGLAPWIDRGIVQHAPHPPWAGQYRIRCGDDIIAGAVVPHDEIVTLSWRHPDVELAYVVELPPRAQRWLASKRGADRSHAPPIRMWPPHATGVRGRDHVGVLLCSRRHGELWCGFETDCSEATAYGTNATLLQVAAGVVAGWHRVGERAGVHVIEELDTRAFVDDVASILGAWRVHHDPRARFVPLPDRRVRGA